MQKGERLTYHFAIEGWDNRIVLRDLKVIPKRKQKGILLYNELTDDYLYRRANDTTKEILWLKKVLEAVTIDELNAAYIAAWESFKPQPINLPEDMN